MDLEIIILSEVREREYHDITYMWNLKKKYNINELPYLQNRNRLTDIENKRMVTKGKLRGRRIN